MPGLARGDVFWLDMLYILPPGEDEQRETRPVIILYHRGVDIIAGMLTTRDRTDDGAVQISVGDYMRGGSRETHYFRPERLQCDHRDYLKEYYGAAEGRKTSRVLPSDTQAVFLAECGCLIRPLAPVAAIPQGQAVEIRADSQTFVGLRISDA